MGLVLRRILPLKSHLLPSLLIAFSALSVVPLHAQTPEPIHVTVDVTDAPRKILHAQLSIPVAPGPLTLLYAKWIPGEHSPDGPIDNLTGIFITGNGAPIRWVRDDVDMYA